MKISFHTDAFNSAVFSFEKAVQWAQANEVHHIECGVIEGACWIHGLGYFPHVSLTEDPLALRRKMEGYGVSFSQVDAAYPLSGKDGPYVGLPYVLKTIPWAKLAGCPNIATTDGLYRPEGLSDSQAMEGMKRSYGAILDVAEAYEVNINIEIHGYFTTKPDMLEKMLEFSKSRYFGVNFDTGNSFIAGQDPVAFLKRVARRVNHVHIKDVSKSLADAARGKDTGIGISHSAIGDGVNADNIREIIAILRDTGYTGVLGLECEGQGGPLIEKSLGWVRKTLKELGIPEER
ncbi:MAG: sugar phosphate isomerase/epimerase [Spirochaetales bacterium]|nr:sugar phosphate isomerase/epimerase [Spirochaetales bacterium]